MPIKIKVKTNKKVEKAINDLVDGHVKVGWFEGQTYPKKKLTVAENAYMQNKGFTIKHKNGTETKVPPRPFVQLTMDKNTNKWNTFWKQEYKQVLDGFIKLKMALNKLGIMVKEDIQKTLKSNVPPKLADSTLKARKTKGNYSETTLIDTKRMYDTINYKSEVYKK